MNIDFSSIKTVVFDLDGTVYYGERLIEGANDVIVRFRQMGKKVCFLTNNSTKSRKSVYHRLTKIGVDCEYEEVITSGYIAALYAKNNNLNNVFIFGSNELVEEFNECGIDIVSEENAENLLIGYNPDMTYDMLTQAVNVALKSKHIIACNKEKLFPGSDKRLMPGCGAMVSSIEYCINREVDYIIGKPNTSMLDMICQKYSCLPKEILMIGDTYESDIVMANNAGCYSIYIGKEIYQNTNCVSEIKNIIECMEEYK